MKTLYTTALHIGLLAGTALGSDQIYSADIQVHGQTTLIFQNELPFHSAYSGPNSLISHQESQLSHTYTLYFGKRLSSNVEAYFNAEMARGGGISNALGLAGYSNGDVIRNPQLSQEIYAARCFLRFTVPISHETVDLEDAPNQLRGRVAKQRMVFTAGKFGTNDIFDTNRYANSTRTQFMNWDLINNAAYDYAADTRGYSIGLTAEWLAPALSLRLGIFQMPSVANGMNLDNDLAHARGDQIELETHPAVLKGREPSVLRFLAYRNVAFMGGYDEALKRGKIAGSLPDIVQTREPGRVKYGFGLNFEQPLADGGETGLFARVAWNNGSTESFAYTEADTSASIGVQFSGRRWHSPMDLVGFALADNGLSAAHRSYLEAGGVGFMLGDGRLNYGHERLFEAYYNHTVETGITLGADVQLIQNPGYNADRGPTPIVSLRMHAEF